MSKITNIAKTAIPDFNWNARASQDIFSFEVLDCAMTHVPMWNYGVSCHDYWIIYWNNSAGGTIVTPEATFDMSPERLFVISPYTPFATSSRQPFRQWYIHFRISRNFGGAVRSVFELPVGTMIRTLQILAGGSDHAARLLALNGLVVNTLGNLPPGTFLPSRTEVIDARIKKAIEIIQNEYNLTFSLTDLSRRVNMSLNNLLLLFKKETLSSPKSYLLDLRLRQACKLLRHSEKTISAIAAETGFADRYHFSKFFKKRTGYTPATFRDVKS